MIVKSARGHGDDDGDGGQERRVPVVALNAHLTCALCTGYFVDATTIIECLHTFCRSCIVRYLAANKYCPVCDVQVHKTRPLLNIRPDKTLQDVVYKVVPRLAHAEAARRRAFYAAHPEALPSSGERRADALYQHLLAPDESVCVALRHHDTAADEDARYLQCPAAVTVACLQKLIRNKYELARRHHVDILYEDEPLGAHLTLVDLACRYEWRRGAPLPITFRICESARLTLLPEPPPPLKAAAAAAAPNNNNDEDAAGAYEEEGWKEVQLRISENGEMSVAGVRLDPEERDCGELLDVLEAEKKPPADPPPPPPPPPPPAAKNVKDSAKPPPAKVASRPKEKEKEAVKKEPPKLKPIVGRQGSERKRKAAAPEATSPPAKKAHQVPEKAATVTTSTASRSTLNSGKPIILNHAAGLLNLSNNHPLRKHPLSVASSKGADAKPKSPPIILNSQYAPKLSAPEAAAATATSASVSYTPINVPSVQKLQAKPAPTYKTLGEPPKPWNPQVARPAAELRHVRPAKFFKVRNNTPRYLGNPASGVKPLYAVQTSDKEERKAQSVVKVDATTPTTTTTTTTTTSSSSNHSELKINTSSVSIFKPLKERKSPHSPNMGKPRAAPSSPSPAVTTSIAPVAATSSSSKSQAQTKAGLTFTPPNPFVPNLQSPTLSPGQFMFPQPPAAFHSYDPMMAAYQSIMATYHRMPYAKYDLHNLQQMGVYPLAGLMMAAAPKGALERKAAASSTPPPPKKARSDAKDKEPSRVKYTSITIKEAAKDKDKEVKAAKAGASELVAEAAAESQDKEEAPPPPPPPLPLPPKPAPGGAAKGEKSLQSALDKLTKAMKPVAEKEVKVNHVAKEGGKESAPPAPPPESAIASAEAPPEVADIADQKVADADAAEVAVAKEDHPPDGGAEKAGESPPSEAPSGESADTPPAEQKQKAEGEADACAKQSSPVASPGAPPVAPCDSNDAAPEPEVAAAPASSTPAIEGAAATHT